MSANMGRTALSPLRGKNPIQIKETEEYASAQALLPLIPRVLKVHAKRIACSMQAMMDMTVVQMQAQMQAQSGPSEGMDMGSMLTDMVGGQMAWEPACLFAAARALEGDLEAWQTAIPASQDFVSAFLEEREIEALLVDRYRVAQVYRIARSQLELFRLQQTQAGKPEPAHDPTPAAFELDFTCVECGTENSAYAIDVPCKRCQYGMKVACACGKVLNLGEIGPSSAEAVAMPHGWTRNLVTAEWVCSDCQPQG